MDNEQSFSGGIVVGVILGALAGWSSTAAFTNTSKVSVVNIRNKATTGEPLQIGAERYEIKLVEKYDWIKIK